MVKNMPDMAGDVRDMGSITQLGRSHSSILAWKKSHGQRSLVGYSRQGRTVLDMTEVTQYMHPIPKFVCSKGIWEGLSRCSGEGFQILGLDRCHQNVLQFNSLYFMLSCILLVKLLSQSKQPEEVIGLTQKQQSQDNRASIRKMRLSQVPFLKERKLEPAKV